MSTFSPTFHTHTQLPAESWPGSVLSLSSPSSFLLRSVYTFIYISVLSRSPSLLSQSRPRGAERGLKRREAQDRKREGWREQGLKHLLSDVWCFNESISLTVSEEESPSKRAPPSEMPNSSLQFYFSSQLLYISWILYILLLTSSKKRISPPSLSAAYLYPSSLFQLSSFLLVIISLSVSLLHLQFFDISVISSIHPYILSFLIYSLSLYIFP